jgi:hypothetical protein
MSERRPVIKLGDYWYLLLQQFTDGQTAIVWKAQQLPSTFQPNPAQHLVQDHAFLMRSGANDCSDFKLDDRPLLALKLPRYGNADDLRKEGNNLSQLSQYGKHDQWMIELCENRSNDPDIPCLILSWAAGQQLDRLAKPLTEQEGITIGYQLAQLIQAVYTLHSKVLTDSIKTNSVFWDGAKITIIDLGLVGVADDLERVAMPLLGETLYRALVGRAAIGDINKDRERQRYDPKPENFGSAGDEFNWTRLSFQTRAIISSLLLGDYQLATTNKNTREERNQILTNLQEAFKSQRDLWQTPDDLLVAARQASDTSLALNAYDIARHRGQTLLPEDEDAYRRHIHSKLSDLLSSASLTRLMPELRWMERRDPENSLIRRTTYAVKAAFDVTADIEPLNWSTIVDSLKQISEADLLVKAEDWLKAANVYRQAVAFINEQFPWRLKSLRLEAWCLASLAEAAHLSDQRPLIPEQVSYWEQHLGAAAKFMNEWEHLDSSNKGVLLCAELLSQRQKEFDEFQKEVIDLENTIKKDIDNSGWGAAEKVATKLGSIYASPHLPGWLSQIKISQLLLQLKTTEARERREAILRGMVEHSSGLPPADPLRTEVGSYLLRYANGYALLDRYEEALTWLDHLQKVQPGDPLKEKTEWRANKASYEREIEGRIEEGTKALAPLRQLVQEGFCFDLKGDSLHFLMVDRLLQLGEFDEAEKIRQQGVAVLSKRLARQEVWLVPEERERIEGFQSNLQREETEIIERRVAVQSTVLRDQVKQHWPESGNKAKEVDLLTLLALLPKINAGDNSLPTLDRVKVKLSSLATESATDDPQNALAILGALRIFYPKDKSINDDFAGYRDQAAKSAYTNYEALKQQVQNLENSHLISHLIIVAQLQALIKALTKPPDEEATPLEAPAPSPDEVIRPEIPEDALPLGDPPPAESALPNLVQIAYENARKMDSNGLVKELEQIIVTVKSTTTVAQQHEPPVEVSELARACLEAIQDQIQATSKPESNSTSLDQASPIKSVLDKLAIFAHMLVSSLESERAEQLFGLNKALMNTGAKYAMDKAYDNPRLVEEIHWHTLEQFRNLITRPDSNDDQGGWQELVEAAFKLWLGYQYQQKKQKKSNFGANTVKAVRLLLTNASPPDWIVLDEGSSQWARCIDWIYRSLVNTSPRSIFRRYHWLTGEQYAEWRHALEILANPADKAQVGNESSTVETLVETPENES